MELQIAERIKTLPVHFFSNLVKKAEAQKAEGMDVIDLGRGSPDLATPPHIVKALKSAAEDPATHRYPLFAGLPELKEAIAVFYKREFDVELSPEKEVAVLFGSKIGVVELPQCIINPRGYCLMPDPRYPDYFSGVHLAQAIPYMIPLSRENDFLPDLSLIPKISGKRAKLMFLNYPNNPTTAVGSREFYEDAVKFAEENGIIIAHDFAYGSIVFDGKTAPSFLSVPGAREVGVEFYSLSKTYNMAGWRVGFG
jgi:aminotransferase